MRDVCRQPALAERAFYSYPRGGESVTGPSVHLARELARCWGNLTHGVTELARDDDAGTSEMMAFAWDVQANTRVALTFISPHARDTRRKGRVELTELRDVYENNANVGARRLREAIFAVLPAWYRDEAVDLCRATLVDGGGKSLAQRTTDAVAAFDAIGVAVPRLEAKVGRPAGSWTAFDLAQLQVAYRSIQHGEVTAGDAFPEARITAADIIGSSPAPEQVTDE